MYYCYISNLNKKSNDIILFYFITFYFSLFFTNQLLKHIKDSNRTFVNHFMFLNKKVPKSSIFSALNLT